MGGSTKTCGTTIVEPVEICELARLNWPPALVPCFVSAACGWCDTPWSLALALLLVPRSFAGGGLRAAFFYLRFF